MNRMRGSMRRGMPWRLLYSLALAALLALPALADDGPMVRKQVAKTPAMESEKAQLSMMQFYVPATRANGELTTLEYFADLDGDNQPDGEAILTRDYAKPLVVTYWDKEPTGAAAYDILTGDEVGILIRRDAWGAFSLDDGDTWKEINLSESALESSFTLDNGAGAPYPGDVTEVFHAVAGNKILVAWASKYCDQGSPRYSLKDADGDGIPDDHASEDPDAVTIYPDPFGVAGSQRSIDYTEWMHHGQYPFAHVGEVPFSCVWTARGTVEQVTSPQTGLPQWGVRWRKAERLTSGRRDAFKLTLDGVEGAGFVVAWQEDPEGLRPGYGEGPGVGWSGATVNHKADIWYSFIGWNDFDLVENPLTPGIPATDPDLLDTNKPQVFERMSMPVRMTDNEKCEMEVDASGNVAGPKVSDDGKIINPYCYDLDLGNGTPAGKGTPDGVGDLCPVSRTVNPDGTVTYQVVDPNRIVSWTNAQGKLMQICVSDDGRMLNGQFGASRARLMLEGYTRPDGTKSAWVAILYEESKGLGAGHTELEPLDIGKDTMYHSFDMFHPDLAAAGHMLNMPETASPELALLYGVAVGDFLPLLPNDLAVARAGGDLYSAVPNQYDTSISRRGNLALQPGSKIAAAAATGAAGGMTSAVLLYKAGADRQGGPADIFMRRIVIPYGFNPATDNPYAVENLVCSEYDTSLTDVAEPTYPRTSYPYGLCVRGATNLSSTTPVSFEPLDNELPEHGITDRVLTWTQSPLNLGDEDWTNKYDVAKGHRGFLDGDFVMIMYGYSPNWLATSKGHEPYNLYIRRSFDGGVTWTTTPASLGGDGTTYDQVLGVGDRAWTETRVLGPGEFEPARNVSQMTSSKDTTLDPRYSPTNIGTQSDIFRILLPDGTYQMLAETDPLYDKRDPSKFFAVYETGDATVVLTAGEADPWDLYASRATNWGDDWDTVDVFAQGRGEWQERWDWIENKDETLSGEASIAASPDGQFAWIVWNQWAEDEADHVFDADPMFRRLWWDDSVTLVAEAGTYEAAEGDLVTLTGSATYDGDLNALTGSAVSKSLETLTFTWDLDTDGEFETAGRIAELRATGAMQGVALRVCNGTGRCDVDQGWINAKIHAPRVWNVRTAETSTRAGAAVSLTARFTDPGTGDSHDAMIDWGDGKIEPALTTEASDGKGAALVIGSHIYDAAGLYTVKVTVTDDDGHSGWDFLRYAVVYDRAAGNIDAPDLYFTDPTGGGTMKLDFHAKYKKEATVPEGRIKIERGTLRFEGAALDWLVVTPAGAIFLRGQGAVNGEGGYDVLVSAVAGKPDLVRMKIWKRNGLNRIVVYDSQPGAADDALATTPVTKGKIKIERD